MQNPRLAGRYAKSLVDLAVETNQLEAIYADMQYLQAVAKSSREFVTIMQSPVIAPEKKVQIEFHPEESYPYLQIYTPEHRKSIAIENLSGAPDAFNNGMGLKVLQPGELATFTTKYITRTL